MEECWGKIWVPASNLKKHCPSSFEEVMGAHASASEEPQSADKKFMETCEKWTNFIKEIHKIFQKNIPGSFEKLQEEQRMCEELQREISKYQQRLNSVMENVPCSLESADAEKRREFISQATLLDRQRHNISWVLQQRKKCIDGFVRLWDLFRCCLLSLNKYLADTKSFITSVKHQDSHSHCLRSSLLNCLESKAVTLQRWQDLYSVVIDTGEKLRSVSDPETSAALQEELSQLQQSWGDMQAELEKNTVQLSNTLQLTRRTADGRGGSSTRS